MRGVVVRKKCLDEERVGPLGTADKELAAAACARGRALKWRHPVVRAVVGALGTDAAGLPVVGRVLDLVKHDRVSRRCGQ
jgi:hypothetical protein